MRFLPLIWSGIWRKPARTALIFLQVTVVFALFGVAQGMNTGFDHAMAKVRADVLFAAPAVVGGTPLTLAQLPRLKAIPGVKAVTYAQSMVTTYQNPKQIVFVLAIEMNDLWLSLLPTVFHVSPQALDALRKTRNGLLITADIGKKYGWHIGETIPLISSTTQQNGSRTWDFQIVGTFVDHELGEAGFVVTNYTYLDEARATDKGTVRNFYVVASDPRQAAAVSDRIDRAFANSAGATQTQAIQDMAQQQLRSLGDLNFAIRCIISAALVALVFSTATMMMQTIRERTPELAVLKTLGFGDPTVFALVAAESLVVCVLAALTGLGLAWFAFPIAGKYFPGLSMPLIVVEAGIVGAVLVALVSVSLPGWRAARLNIVDALAGR